MDEAADGEGAVASRAAPFEGHVRVSLPCRLLGTGDRAVSLHPRKSLRNLTNHTQRLPGAARGIRCSAVADYAGDEAGPVLGQGTGSRYTARPSREITSQGARRPGDSGPPPGALASTPGQAQHAAGADPVRRAVRQGGEAGAEPVPPARICRRAGSTAGKNAMVQSRRQTSSPHAPGSLDRKRRGVLVLHAHQGGRRRISRSPADLAPGFSRWEIPGVADLPAARQFADRVDRGRVRDARVRAVETGRGRSPRRRAG